MRNLIIASLFFLAAVLTACSANTRAVKGYTPQRTFIVASSRAEILSTVAEHITDSGWEIIAHDADAGRIVALTPNTSEGQTTTRERWTFRAVDGVLEAQMRFEASFDPGVWVTSPWVCDTYSYAREHAQLQAVADRAAEIRLTVAARSAIASK